MDLPLAFSIADMYGPHFLIFYGVVIAVVLLVVASVVRSADKTTPPESVPESPDPYEVAYLRGGENEVTRLAILELCQKDHLEMIEERVGLFGKEQRLALKPGRPSPDTLSPMLREMLTEFACPRTAQEVFQSAGILNCVRPYASSWEREMEDQSLRTDPAVTAVATIAGTVGGLIVAGLGGYKLLAALDKGATTSAS